MIQLIDSIRPTVAYLHKDILFFYLVYWFVYSMHVGVTKMLTRKRAGTEGGGADWKCCYNQRWQIYSLVTVGENL